MAEEETDTGGATQGGDKTPTVRATAVTPSNGLEASLMAAGATGLEFVGDGNNADLVALIKEAAIFKYAVGDSVGTLAADWKPEEGKKPFGYFSEDGITIHPEAGDDNDFLGHNGDTVVSMASGGYWTIQFAALEGKKEVIETYFDTTVAEDGSITVTSSEIKQYAQYVVAGLTQSEKLILMHIPKAKISERDDIVWTISDLQNFNMTLRMFKGGDATPYLFKAWGFAQDVPATPAA